MFHPPATASVLPLTFGPLGDGFLRGLRINDPLHILLLFQARVWSSEAEVFAESLRDSLQWDYDDALEFWYMIDIPDT